MHLESAPVESALEALSKAANAGVLGTLLHGDVLDLNGIDAASRALTVGAA